MKKILAFMVACLMIMLAGCFSNDNPPANPTTTDYEETVTTTESADITEDTTNDWELPIDMDTTVEDTTEEVTTEDTTEEPEATTTKPAPDNTTTEPDTTVPETTHATEPETTVPVTEPETTVPPTSSSSSGPIELPMIPG